MSNTKGSIRAYKTLALDGLDASPRQAQKWAFSHRTVVALAMTLDVAIILAAGLLSSIAYHFFVFGAPVNVEQSAEFAAAVGVLFVIAGKSYDLYEIPRLMNFRLQVRQILTLWVLLFLVLTMIAFALKAGVNFSRGATLLFAITGPPMLLVARNISRAFLANNIALRSFAGRKVAVIADRERRDNSGLLDSLKRHGMEISDYLLMPASNNVSDLKEIIAHAVTSVRGSTIEEIVVNADLARWPNLKCSLSELRVLPLPVHLVPSGSASELFKLPNHTMGETVVIELQRAPRSLLEQAIIRTFDIIVAGAALVLLLPVFLLTSLAIALDSPGAIIFRQRRRGFNGRTFEIFKFRTMSVIENDGVVVQAQRNDPRVTNLGHWLRRTSIDELPQLLNVLKGDMSIVGPRPHAVAHDSEFDKLVDNYAYRHHVKPGLTGWAQVNGFRGQTKSVGDIKKRVDFDLWYINNWSLLLDFKIIVLTTIEIIRGRNAY